MNTDLITKFKASGLVDLQKLDPRIDIDLKYATNDNFTGTILYTTMFNRAFCEIRTAEAVVRANEYLGQIAPGKKLLIWDAARPISVQKKMYEHVRGTKFEQYVAKPDSLNNDGGFHNYGLAVDLTIVNEYGQPLDMGTGFDEFTSSSHPFTELHLVKTKKISIEAYANRMLLFHVMGRYGMLPYEYEWWHFQLFQSEEDKKNFTLLNF